MKNSFTTEQNNWFTRQKIIYSQIKKGITQNSNINKDVFDLIGKYKELYDETQRVKAYIINNYYIPPKKTKKEESCEKECNEFIKIVLDNYNLKLQKIKI